MRRRVGGDCDGAFMVRFMLRSARWCSGAHSENERGPKEGSVPPLFPREVRTQLTNHDAPTYRVVHLLR